jgi:hypothetical protein
MRIEIFDRSSMAIGAKMTANGKFPSGENRPIIFGRRIKQPINGENKWNGVEMSRIGWIW